MAEHRNGRGNAGWFRKGADERRHELTGEERRKGFLTLARRARSRNKRGRQAAYVLDCLTGSRFKRNRGWPGDTDGIPPC